MNKRYMGLYFKICGKNLVTIWCRIKKKPLSIKGTTKQMTVSSISTKLKGIQWPHYFYSLHCSANSTARPCFGTGLVLVLIETWAMNLPTWKEDRAANAVCKHLFCRPEKDEECWPGGKCYIKRMMTSIRIVTPSQIRYFKKAVARSNIIPLAYPVLWVYVVKLIIIHIFCCYC